ncbi:MAG: hypothetical protein QXY61_01435 [Candidatus Anstonellales archaeon]
MKKLLCLLSCLYGVSISPLPNSQSVVTYYLSKADTTSEIQRKVFQSYKDIIERIGNEPNLFCFDTDSEKIKAFSRKYGFDGVASKESLKKLYERIRKDYLISDLPLPEYTTFSELLNLIALDCKSMVRLIKPILDMYGIQTRILMAYPYYKLEDGGYVIIPSGHVFLLVKSSDGIVCIDQYGVNEPNELLKELQKTSQLTAARYLYPGAESGIIIVTEITNPDNAPRAFFDNSEGLDELRWVEKRIQRFNNWEECLEREGGFFILPSLNKIQN